MKNLMITVCALAASTQSAAIQVFDDSIKAGETKNWTANNEYVLNGFVFVEAGARLNIAAGTVVKAKPGTGTLASALIVCRNGRLYATGTAQSPVIFTAEADDVADPEDLALDFTSKSLWGGLILLGKAPNNNPGQVMQAEGVPPEFLDLINYGDSANASDPVTGVPANPTAHAANSHDNSGVLQYVSIRHSGSVLAANKEINGLTLCSVGDSTVIDHVEVYNGGDDGFEWFGGTVNGKYLVSVFCDDDAFDYDQAYVGKAQFLFALQDRAASHSNRIGEFDGDDAASAGFKPYSTPVWFNGTFIGSGGDSTGVNTLNDYALIYKDNAAGTLANSIITEFSGTAVKIEDKASGADARQRLEAGDIKIMNNVIWRMGKTSSPGTGLADSTWSKDTLLAHGNVVSNPMLTGISRLNDGMLIPQPSISGPAYSDLATVPVDGFFTSVAYKGAFSGNTQNWAKGWTFLDAAGFFGIFATTDGETQVRKGPGVSTLSVTGTLSSPALRYSVANAGHVRISIFDIRGRKVAEPVNGSKLPGRYSVKLNGSHMPAGYYAVRMAGDSRTLAVKGMVLAK